MLFLFRPSDTKGGSTPISCFALQLVLYCFIGLIIVFLHCFEGIALLFPTYNLQLKTHDYKNEHPK
jgi:hypothetical protein